MFEVLVVDGRVEEFMGDVIREGSLLAKELDGNTNPLLQTFMMLYRKQGYVPKFAVGTADRYRLFFERADK